MGEVEVISFLRGLTSAWGGVTKFSPSQAPTRCDEILPVCFKPRPRSGTKKILSRGQAQTKRRGDESSSGGWTPNPKVYP